MSVPDAFLVLRITQPRQDIFIGPCNEGFKHIRLIQYRVTGHDPLQTLYFRFRNESTIPVHGSVGNRYPLIFVADTAASGVNPNISGKFDVTGEHQFNDAKKLDIEIDNFDGSPAVFTELILVFEGYHHFRTHTVINQYRGAEHLARDDLVRFLN